MAWETLGWVGIVLLMAGHSLLSFGFIRDSERSFWAINLAASIMLLALNVYKQVPQLIILETYWIAFSIKGVLRPPGGSHGKHRQQQ